jgi:hypothetical protein
MNRLLTTLLVWLLMATLPLHAVAASVNLSCAPAPHHMGAAPHTADHPAAHPAAHPAPASDEAHAHHDIHASHAGDTVAATHTADGEHAGSTELPHSSCSACSVFCVGAVAPPSALLALPGVDGSESVVIAPVDFVTGFIPDGPQRPPRQ